MFPNIRLMIVTVLAAILGIGCGLGLFATFRVNHEPLALLSNGSVPLQLAWEKGEPAPKPSPWGVRYPVNGGAKPIAAPVLPAQLAPADTHATEPAPAAAAMAATNETAVRIAPGESKPEGAVIAIADSSEPPIKAAPAADSVPAANTAPTAEAAPAAETDRATEAAPNPVAETAPDAETTPTAEAAPTPQTAPVPEAASAAETAPAGATTLAAQTTPAVVAGPASETAATAAEAARASETAAPETASAASTAPAAGAAPTADTASTAESAPAAQNGPAAEAAPTMAARQGASAAPASGEEGKPMKKETTAALNSQTPATQKPAAQGASANSAGDREAGIKDVKRRVVKQQEVKTARPAPRRVTKVLRWHRPQTAIASQSTGLFSQPVSEPAYQWTDTAAQPPQTIRRIVIRQRRVILKKPAPKPSRQSSRTNQGSVADGAQ